MAVAAGTVRSVVPIAAPADRDSSVTVPAMRRADRAKPAERNSPERTSSAGRIGATFGNLPTPAGIGRIAAASRLRTRSRFARCCSTRSCTGSPRFADTPLRAPKRLVSAGLASAASATLVDSTRCAGERAASATSGVNKRTRAGVASWPRLPPRGVRVDAFKGSTNPADGARRATTARSKPPTGNERVWALRGSALRPAAGRAAMPRGNTAAVASSR